MKSLSVVICCANCADTLGPAIASARFADEVIVVDSGSTDDTPRVAAAADRYVVEPWRGYTKQKQFGAELAAHDWVFVLDGDEAITPDLAREVRALTDDQLDQLDVLSCRRRNFVMGRHVRAWDPDWQSRLIHRRRCAWADEVLHDARRASDPSRHRRLTGHLEHKRHSTAGFKDYFDGQLEDSRILDVARQMHARGRRARVWDLWMRPLGAFVKFYLLKRGFLDGAFGLLIAQKAARGAQLKYASLWALQRGLIR